MGSPKGQICKQDIHHWGQVATVAVTMSVLDVVGTTVIPELQNAGGTTNCIIVTVLTLLGDLIRRWISDTRNRTPNATPNDEQDNNEGKIRKIGLLRKTLIKLGFSKCR